MRGIPTIQVEMTFSTKAEGGREQPPVLTEPTSYRPHLVVDSGQLLGVIFFAAPETVQAGDPFTATLGLVYYPKVDYAVLVPGAEFTVYEGSRIVGYGRIISRENTIH